MTAARTTRTTNRRRARELCPLRPQDLKQLRTALAKLTPTVPITGWEDSAPQWVTPPPWELVPEAVFDVAAVVRAIKALCELRHTKGRWARRPLVPDPWQVVWVIAPVFGWKYPADYHDTELAGTRIYREVYIEVPRKNGKSTLSSGLAIVLLAADSEAGAEVYAAAGSRDQARVVFDQSKSLAQTSKKLTDRLSIMTSLIRHPRTGSFYRVLSKSEEAAHGLNVHGAVIDELHVHKRRGLVDAIETGTGAREQPMIITITTADDGGEGTIYEEKHERIRKCAQRIITIEKQYGIIWAADDDDDPFAESTWRKANPGLGTSPTLAYIRAEANKARSSASYFPVFCRLHLNRRIRQQVRFISLEEWDQQDNIQTVLADQLKGRECYGGLDLSATTDLTSFQLVFPDAEHQTLTVLTQLWMPESDLQMRIERDQVPYDEWASNGWLTLTEGNVVDYDKVTAAIDHARANFDLRAVHHDRWQAGPVVQKLQGMNIESSPVPQTYGGMSEPTKMLDRLVKQGRFVHGAHPVLRWMADSVEVMRDRANPDNVRPVKPNREKSSKRVDGITATVMAIDAWMRRPEAPAAPSSVSGTGTDGPGDDFFRPSRRLNL
jgi:phage terminase large subunit-like protein